MTVWCRPFGGTSKRPVPDVCVSHLKPCADFNNYMKVSKYALAKARSIQHEVSTTESVGKRDLKRASLNMSCSASESDSSSHDFNGVDSQNNSVDDAEESDASHYSSPDNSEDSDSECGSEFEYQSDSDSDSKNDIDERDMADISSAQEEVRQTLNALIDI